MILILLLYAVIPLTFTIAKLGLLYSNPFFFISARMLLAGAFLVFFYFLKNYYTKGKFFLVPYKKWKFDPIIFLLFFKVTLFHVYLSFVPEFWAMQYISSIKVNIMYTVTPFVTFIISYFLFNQKITLIQLMATLISFLGLIPLVLRSESPCVKDIFSFSLPEFMLILGIVSAAYAWFVIKQLMDKGYSLLLINGISMLFGGVMIFFTWYFSNPVPSYPVYDFRAFILITITLVFLSNILAYNLQGWLLRFYSINLLAVAGFLSPVFGALYGRFFLGESVVWQHYLAIVCIATGLYLFYRKGINV